MVNENKQDERTVVWHNMRELSVEGRGWDNSDDFYRRLPAKAQSKVTDDVWQLSSHSAGMVARFVTDSDEIDVRWKLTCETLAMPHMPATGVSGVDLYVRFEGKWRWLDK